MARALIIQYDPADAAALAARIEHDGFIPSVYGYSGPKGFRAIREDPPDVIVIDLMRAPSYGRAMGSLLRESKSLRTIPLVFVQGDPEKTVLVRRRLPDAIVAPWERLGPALRRAIASPPADPASPMPSNTPLYRKLGIRSGFAVALRYAPEGIEGALGKLPKGVRLQASTAEADMLIVFVKTAATLGRELPGLARDHAGQRKLWLVWPKKKTGGQSDISMPIIMDMGRRYGLAVGKLCSFDETWSALAFSQRRAR